MNLAQYIQTLPRPIAELRGLWLVLDLELRENVLAAQVAGALHRVQPVELTDGRFALCADLLSEIGPTGIFRDAFSKLNRGNFPLVEVLPWAEIEELLPTEEA